MWPVADCSQLAVYSYIAKEEEKRKSSPTSRSLRSWFRSTEPGRGGRNSEGVARSNGAKWNGVKPCCACSCVTLPRHLTRIYRIFGMFVIITVYGMVPKNYFEIFEISKPCRVISQNGAHSFQSMLWCGTMFSVRYRGNFGQESRKRYITCIFTCFHPISPSFW